MRSGTEKQAAMHGHWRKTTEDGSYLVADIPYEAAFALVYTAADHTLYYAGGGAAVVLLLIVLIIRKRRKRAQKK